MSVERLIARLDAEGAHDRDALLDKAREDANQRTVAAQTQAQERLSYALQMERARLEAQSQARLHQARRTEQARVLKAREQMLQRAKAAVRARLGTLLRDTPPLTDALVAEALGYGTAHPVLHVSPGVAAAVTGKPVRTVPDLLDADGVRAVSEDGTAQVDATLQTLVEVRWPELSVFAVKRVDALGPAP